MQKKTQICFYLVNRARWSNFVGIYDPHGISANYSVIFQKIFLPLKMVAILNFCIFAKKCKNTNFLLSARWSDFNEIFDPQGMSRVNWWLLPKIVFQPFLAAILDFCEKRKNAFISGKERDRAISMKFLTHWVSAEYTGEFLTKCFAAIFGSHLEFLCKTQIRIYLGNCVR